MSDVAFKHQLRIAMKTLQLTDLGADLLGGMSKAEARHFLGTRCGWSAGEIERYETGEVSTAVVDAGNFHQ